MGTVKKYVCQYGDLDKLLDGTLKAEFQGLFPNPEVSEDKSAWRMYYGEFDLADFLDQFGIKYNSPRVRDAVAFDLVKLDDIDENSIGSVSNDSIYTYEEHKVYSPLEYERFLLNKNFRVNLAKLEPEWSNLTFSGKPSDQGSDDDSSNLDDESSTSRTRTVDRVYQGARMSKTLLSYFDSVFNNAFEDGEVKSGFDMSQIYVPFTNANDFTTEISLIPHTHPDFRAITSRAYYDKKYIQYKKLLKKYNITGISTFALVDPDKDKNHTGQYLVKVQRKINENKYDYIVATIDKDGKIMSTPEVFKSTTNTILCVCAKDFASDRELSTSIDTWTPVESDVPMVKSTTSSHYSVFRQRIPDYDLKLVRHYFQFKNRLEGMELCLWILERSIYMKEVQASECFAKETMVLHRLFQEFSKNKEIMELVKRYYDLIAEWDELVVKREQLSSIKDEKLQLLNKLLEEYNALGNNQLDKKLALGAKIQSLKLELDKRLKTSVIAINERLEKIREEVGDINAKIQEIYNRPAYGLTDEVKEKLKGTLADLKKAFDNDLTDEEKMEKGLVNLTDLKTHIANRANERKNKLGNPKVVPDLKNKPQSSINGLKQDLIDSTNGKLWNNYNIHFGGRREAPPEHEAGGIHAIDTSELHKLILQSERWRGFMFSMGYELNQLKKMKTICEDATIKVRRLVHNFEEKMADVESQVWDSNHALRSDFSFTGIAASSLREIILLYDWYAANAPGKTYQEMGFEDEDQFLEFRRRCNKISFNLRKNQYAEMLNIKRDKLSNIITDLRNKIDSMNELKYHDKYGEEGAKEHREEDGWSVNDVTKEQLEYVEEQVKPGLGVEVERTAPMMAFTETQKARDEIKRIQMFNDAEQFLSKRVDEGIQVLTDELWQRRESAVRRLSDEINRISVFGVQDFQYEFDNSIGVLPQVNDVLDAFKDVELPSDFDRENVKALVGWMKKWHLRQNMGLSVFGGIYGELEDLQCAIQMRDCYRRGLDSGVNLFARMDGKIQLKPENYRYLNKMSDSGLDVFGNAEASIQFDPDIGIRLGSCDCGINLFSSVDKFIHIDSSSGVPIGGFLDSNLNLFTMVDGNMRVDGLLDRSLHKTVNIPSSVDLNELRGRIGSVKMQQKRMGDRIGVFNANFDYINGELDAQLNRFVPRKCQLEGSIRVFDVHNLDVPMQEMELESRIGQANAMFREYDMSVAVFGQSHDGSFIEPHTAYGIKERRRPVYAFDVESELKRDFDDALVDRRTFTGKIKVFDAYSLKDAISIQETVNVEINRNSARTSSKVLILGAGDVSSVDDRQGIGSRVEQVKSKRKSHGDSMAVFDRLSHNGLIDINEAISRLYRIRKTRNAHEQSMVIFERTGLSGFTDSNDIMERKESAEQSRIIRERGIVVFNTGVPDILDENEIVSRKHMAIEHQRGLEQRLSAFDDNGLKLEHEGVNKAMDVIVESAQGSISRINEFTSLDEYLAQKERVDRQYRVDQELMADRTISYLKGIGLIKDVEDIEKMALRNRALQYEGDTSDKIFAIQDSKDNLDHAIRVMCQQRESLQSIIDNLEQAESRIEKLTQENQRIFNACLLEKDRQNRNRLLLQKLENENQLMELRGIVKRIKKEHLEDFSELERMRSDVDDWQMKYNESVREFKEEIGLNQDTMNQLMIGIYNRWQDEILEQSEGK